MNEIIYKILHIIYTFNIPFISNKLFKYDLSYDVHTVRTNAKLNEIYINWNKSNKNNPTEYLNKVSTFRIEDSLVYYWICEDDMTKLTNNQLEKMREIGLRYFYYL